MSQKKIIVPDWIKKVMRARKARERYFLKRYGSLERMHAIDDKWQREYDDSSWADELKACGMSCGWKSSGD